ncbi:MAG: hypothetical protein LDL41_06450 [Coleofasciculus sp. S288]|nr:hypothetical protein [Coleofasciculus sp. S288]
MLLLTGGKPSKFAIDLSFVLGVLFVTVSDRWLTPVNRPKEDITSPQTSSEIEPTDTLSSQNELERFIDWEDQLIDAMQEAAVMLHPANREAMAKEAVDAVLGIEKNLQGGKEQFYRDIEKYLRFIQLTLNRPNLSINLLEQYHRDEDFDRREVHIKVLNYIIENSETYRNLSPAATTELKRYITFLSNHLSGVAQRQTEVESENPAGSSKAEPLT